MDYHSPTRQVIIRDDMHAVGATDARPLGHLLDLAVTGHGDQVALRVDGQQWTYSELAALVERCAAALHRRGVGAGSRVALSAANSPEFVAVVFAAARLGAALVMISTAWRDGEVQHALA